MAPNIVHWAKKGAQSGDDGKSSVSPQPKSQGAKKAKSRPPTSFRDRLPDSLPPYSGPYKVIKDEK